MIAFLSLIHRIGVPFSLSLFRHICRLRVKGKSWASFSTRAGLGVIRGASKLDPGWRSWFVFTGVPGDFFLPRSWINIDGFRDLNPQMSEADDRSLRVLTNVAF